MIVESYPNKNASSELRCIFTFTRNIKNTVNVLCYKDSNRNAGCTPEFAQPFDAIEKTFPIFSFCLFNSQTDLIRKRI